MRTKTKAGSALPAGFTDTSGGGNFPQAWIPKRDGDTLHGVVTAKRKVDAKTLGRKNAKKGESVLILTIADTDGVLHSFFASYATEQFCQLAAINDEVFIKYDGQKKIGKKRLNLYTTGIKSKKGKGK